MARRNLQTRPVPEQHGAYTLATVMFLLLILGLSSVFATQISINEQRIARNAFYILQAKQNAQIISSDISSKLRWNDIRELTFGEKITHEVPVIETPSGKPQGSGIVELLRLDETTFKLTVTAKSPNDQASYNTIQNLSFHKLFHVAGFMIFMSFINCFIHCHSRQSSPAKTFICPIQMKSARSSKITRLLWHGQAVPFPATWILQKSEKVMAD